MTRPLIALALLALVACRPDDSALFRVHDARSTGITFVNQLTEDDSIFNPLDFDYLYNGAGVAVADLNNDGLPDLYFAGNMVSSRLYLNQGDFTFRDVTEGAGVGTEVWATGVTMVDINDDGLMDIYVAVAGQVPPEERKNLLFINQGPDENGIPHFEERAEQYGLADTGYSTHAVFFDYDRDGHLDMYLLTNALELFSRNLIRPKKVSGESQSTDRLYRNNGDGTFTDVSAEAGILIEGYGLGVVVSDLNGDGWPDIYVGNDFHTNDLVWINNQDGTFTNRAAEYLKHQTHNAMGVDVADINNDGLVDIMVLDMLPEDNYRQKMMLSGSNYEKFRMSLSYGYEPQYMRNTLQLNNGPGPTGHPTFSEIGQLSGVHQTDWSWAPLLADFDNDGFRDLFVSNGYRRDVTNLDFIVYTQQTAGLGREERNAALAHAMRELPEVEIPNYIFRNQGDLTFADVTREWGLDFPGFSNGAAYVDLDGDGDLDLVISNLDGPPVILENRAERLGHNHLRLRFEGPPGNRHGLGAKVTVFAGDQLQFHEQTPYRGYKSTVEKVMHFGLGTAPQVDSLEIVWPDGRHQRLREVAVNQELRVRFADATDANPMNPQPQATPRFTTAMDVQGLARIHEERELVDFKVTPMLPHKLSRGNPGIAIGDVDGNGLDDLYIGADRGVPRSLLLQTAPGRFEERVLETEYSRFEDMGALFFDANGNGHLDLYVVSGGGFPGGRMYQDRLYVNDGQGNLVRDIDALPEEDVSGSVVVAGDFDRDGDLDLFVGGRVIPGEYPLPPRSFLLRNDSEPGGPPRFTDVTEEVAPELAEIGLVTTALWTDFDGDGQIDLIVAGEWMPITFFRNVDGRLVDVTESTGLGGTHGWWNSIVAGDFDNDGDIDYIVGNLGLNSIYTASEEEPVRIHAADFDNNGSIDPVISRYIQGESYPVASRDILIDQMVPMKGRFPRYDAYAVATLEQTLSDEERARAYQRRITTLESVYLENLGDGTFAMRPLPMRAQFAPIFGMLVGDHDGDGNLDVIAIGNSHAAEVQGGWFTASTGALLLGDGAGNFRVESGNESGFYVDGDAKALARLHLGGSSTVLLATQNSDSLRTFRSTLPGPRRFLRLRQNDAYALITLADGCVRREEFHHGAGYLSQSSRILEIPPGAREVRIYDFLGNERVEAGES